jgi:hypothetical protein
MTRPERGGQGLVDDRHPRDRARAAAPAAGPPARPGAPHLELVPAEVIGIVADTRAVNLWERPVPLLYLPLAQNPHRLMTFLVRTAGAVDPTSLQPVLRRELRQSHPEMAIVDALPFALHLERSLWNQRMSSQFLASPSSASWPASCRGPRPLPTP